MNFNWRRLSLLLIAFLVAAIAIGVFNVISINMNPCFTGLDAAQKFCGINNTIQDGPYAYHCNITQYLNNEGLK